MEMTSNVSTETEPTPERQGIFLGRLKDFGLGNPDGIPSIYATASNEELERLARDDAEALVDPQSETTFSCGDGRERIGNADGSEPMIRLRRFGGTASNLGVALNADAPVFDHLPANSSFGQMVTRVDTLVGIDRSAHNQGCGSAKGETAHNQAIGENPAIANATKTFLNIPQVAEYLATSYDEVQAERVRVNTVKTADVLEAAGWDGNAYVAGVQEQNPGGVENLRDDPTDRHHGHKESRIKIIIGDKTSSDGDVFTANLKASKIVAERLSGGDEDVYARVIIAELNKMFAVANDLPSPETPVELLIA